MRNDRRQDNKIHPYKGYRPVISKSECGSYKYDGDKDMKVLRKRAEAAVRYFNNGDMPRILLCSNVFGYPFSIIENGKLVDAEHAYKGNVIMRYLSDGIDKNANNLTLYYSDRYNDGRGQGGYGATIIGNVRDVRIRGEYLVISGYNGDKPISYSYRIQEYPDTQRFTYPIPKGGRVPDTVEKRKRTLDDWNDVPKKSVYRTETPQEAKKTVKPNPTKAKPSKPVEQPKKTVTKTTTKPKTSSKKPKDGSQMFEVRVGGMVKGSFSSKSKAEKMKKELRSQGLNAKIVGVF